MEKTICTGESGIRVVTLRDPMRTAPEAGECELAYVEEGIMTLRGADGKPHTLRKGQGYFMRGGSGMSLTAVCSGRVNALRFPSEVASSVMSGYDLRCPVLERSGGEVSKLIHMVRGELEEKKFGYCVAAESEIKRFLLDMCRSCPLVYACRATAGDTDGLFGDLLAEIDRNYAEYTFDDAARFMCLSRAYFSVAFHKYTGTTFSQYLNYVRVRSAVAMLRSGEKTSITDVSVRCGFNTIRNFNRAFRDITGYSPRTLPEDYELPLFLRGA